MMCLRSMRLNREPISPVVVVQDERVLVVELSVPVAAPMASVVGQLMNKDACWVGTVIIILVVEVWLGYYQAQAALVLLILVTRGTRGRRR